jgi:hypothetical protein
MAVTIQITPKEMQMTTQITEFTNYMCGAHSGCDSKGLICKSFKKLYHQLNLCDNGKLNVLFDKEKNLDLTLNSNDLKALRILLAANVTNLRDELIPQWESVFNKVKFLTDPDPINVTIEFTNPRFENNLWIGKIEDEKKVEAFIKSLGGELLGGQGSQEKSTLTYEFENDEIRQTFLSKLSEVQFEGTVEVKNP